MGGKRLGRKNKLCKKAQITEFRTVPQPIRVTETDLNRERKEGEGSETKQDTTGKQGSGNLLR